MALRHRACGIVAFLLAVSAAVAQTGAAETGALDREIQRGETALRQGQYAEAIRHFEQAERLGGPPSAELNAGIAIAELQLGHYETARQREAKVLELVSTDHERAESHNVIGTAWLREAGQGAADLDKLRSAEEAFERAVVLDPVFDAAYFNLGNALLRQNREAEGEAAFKKFIDAAAKNPASGQDLPLTPLTLAPAFTIKDNKGREVSSDSLRGRFVLLDYWATWCPPCIRALPVMCQLADYFPPEQFTLLSIDEDAADQDVWRKFIAQQKMNWTQAWDKNGDVYFSFNLAPRPDVSIPRYVLLDGDGFIRRVYTGTDRLGLAVGQIVRTVTAAPKRSREPASVPSAPAATKANQP
jgi:tetratricopeptide (TPR) repeat protein